MIDDAGPDHAKTFTAWVVVAGERYGGSDGRSKKQAEQRAAAAAWRTLTERLAEAGGDAPGRPSADGAKPIGPARGPEADATVDARRGRRRGTDDGVPELPEVETVRQGLAK